MGKTTEILRTSIFTFLQNYQLFTSTPTLLAFPFAASTLLSQSLVSSSRLFLLLHDHLRSIFLAVGFPLSSTLATLLNLKLCQMILTSLFASPFALSFLLLAKASIITSIKHQKTLKNSFSQSIQLFTPLLITQLCNFLILVSANATCFCLLSILFVFFGFSFGLLQLLSVTGGVIYSIVLANAYMISNLASVLSGIEQNGGFISIFRACFLIRGRTTTALSLAVSINLGLVSIESLFQYRVVRGYDQAMGPSSSMVLEGILIAYLYSLVLVLDTLIGYLFLKSCKTEDVYFQLIETQEGDSKNFSKIMC